MLCVALPIIWAKTLRETHYFWMQHDPSYPVRFRQAEMQAARTLEDELRRPILPASA